MKGMATFVQSPSVGAFIVAFIVLFCRSLAISPVLLSAVCRLAGQMGPGRTLTDRGRQMRVYRHDAVGSWVLGRTVGLSVYVGN